MTWAGGLITAIGLVAVSLGLAGKTEKQFVAKAVNEKVGWLPERGTLLTCRGCHSQTDRAVQTSAHGQANLDCIVCHTFTGRRHRDPDVFVRGRFFARAGLAVCERCHIIIVRQWRQNRHVNPLDVLFDRFKPRGAASARARTALTLKDKAENPCLICHEAHGFDPGLERRGGVPRRSELPTEDVGRRRSYRSVSR